LTISVYYQTKKLSKIEEENKILEEKLIWDEELKIKVAEMKTKWDGIGGYIEATKEDIDKGILEGIQDKIDVLPKEYLETIFAERLIEHGLKKYHWIYKSFDYPVQFPNKSYISSEFYHMRKYNGKIVYHGGIDIVCTNDYRVLASAEGTIQKIGYNSILGKYIIIKHVINKKHYITEYAHLDNIYVKKGQDVGKGDVLALIGLTGNTNGYHLHFALKYWHRSLKKYIPVNMVATTTYKLRIK
jgi:murein DD-endopeptidase MepM/ murein hydrolase activator NlpD